MTVVELRNLTLQRGRRQILSQLSLDLRAGELTVLLGPNGTGKSTLLKCISGEIASQGEIRLFGQPQSLWPAPILARRMAILPQSSALSFSFLAREVVALGRLPHASGKIADEAIIQRCLQAVGAEHLADSAYTVLSGGEKQRIHFARVLAQLDEHMADSPQTEREPTIEAPKLLMLDEPTSALDLSHQHQTLQTAQRRARQGDAVLVILHDLNLAARYADRVLLLNHGQIQADGSPEEVLTAECIKQIFAFDAQVFRHPETGRLHIS